jgi:nucleotide-binding universal stress UspA family protein
MTTLLVPLDGSELATRALPYAAALARRTRGRVLLVHVGPVTTLYEGQRRTTIAASSDVQSLLADAAEWLRTQGVDSDSAVVDGEVPPNILRVAREQGADVVVMSTHGRGGLGRVLYGSVADRVVREAALPVMLVPAATEVAWPDEGPLRILLPLDGSDPAERALGPLGELAGAMGAELVLLRVVEPARPAVQRAGFPPTYAVPTAPDPEPELEAARAYLEDVAARLRGKAPVVGVRAEVGSPATTIAALARAEAAHLIAMATHGRGGLTRLVMGNVATGTLQHATTPVLLFPTAAPSA